MTELVLPKRRPRGLLVEDDPAQLRRRSEILDLRDLLVADATSQEDAIRQYNHFDRVIDVVITDLNLDEGHDTLGGIGVAKHVRQMSGGQVAVFGYTGKKDKVPNDSRHLFTNLIVKSASARAAVDIFDQAAEVGRAHRDKQLGRAIQILEKVIDAPAPLMRQDALIVNAAVPWAIEQKNDPPLSIGILEIEGISIPIAVFDATTIHGADYAASVLGHEHVVGLGGSPEEATSQLGMVIHGFAELEPSLPQRAIGASKRWRGFIRELTTAIESREPTNEESKPDE